jgi:pimeloyl-ACP methyl ester carboxylesterase
VQARETTLGELPCLVAGEGPALVMLGGLSAETGVAPGPMRSTIEAAMRPWTRARTVHYLNRRPALSRGMSMAELAAEHAAAIAAGFAAPVDVLGVSTGGSIAQQLAAEHPGVVRRLVLGSTACRLGTEGRREQARVAARLRAGATPQALAVLGAALTPPGPWRFLAGLAGRIAGPRLVSEQGLADMATTMEAEDAFDLARLPAIAAPTLIIAGGRDRFYSRALFEETAALIPGSRLELFERRGHITVLSSPRALATGLGFLGH